MGKIIGDCTEEKWIAHYSTSHKILVVGEGDFSFSACLARAFGSGVNMVATSFDCRGSLYSLAIPDLEELEQLSCSIFHGVDATSMSQFPPIAAMSFDRIIFVFSGWGFACRQHIKYYARLHRDLVKDFLINARSMLSENGEIHITHKKLNHFNWRNMTEVAEEVGFRQFKECPFDIGHSLSTAWKPYRSFIGKCTTLIFKAAE